MEIESVQSRGYRMPGGAQWLSESRLASTLRRSYPAVQVKVFDSIDSTNERALAQSAPWPELQVLMAEHQTSGRGRRGRGWVSPWGHNLYMSCAVAFTDGLPAGASIRAGCAVASVLHKHGVKGVGLKWPNDLQVVGHKVGGILVEIQGDPTGHCRAVVGLGLNLKTPTKAGVQIDQPYADLRQVGLPDTVSRSLLAGRVAKALADALLKPREDWVAQFTRWDVLADQPVRASGAQNVMQVSPPALIRRVTCSYKPSRVFRWSIQEKSVSVPTLDCDLGNTQVKWRFGDCQRSRHLPTERALTCLV